MEFEDAKFLVCHAHFLSNCHREKYRIYAGIIMPLKSAVVIPVYRYTILLITVIN